MNTLYLSDLDGTLLNDQAELSENSIQLLNQALDQGLLFTAATARSPATAVKILEPLHLNLPVCMLNGSFLYDIPNHRFSEIKSISLEAVEKITDAAQKAGKTPLYYSIMQQQLIVYFQKLDNEETDQFVSERKSSPYKRFVQIRDLHEIPSEAEIVFLVFLDRPSVLEKIIPTADHLLNQVQYTYYHDVYHPEQFYLEISSASASKAASAKTLQNLCGADQLKVFGDNRNDLPMLKIADQALAPENATEEVKKYADQILESNLTDSVARFITQDYYGGIHCE